ncbi:MAG: histidine phosphotransferase family protein [Kiloniellaceae bacterium]
MDFQIDMRVAELLASRLCHCLVGPIGAVNNGVELMADDAFGMSGDAMELVANSARRAASALQFYRLAYGMAGDRPGSDPSELHDLAAGFLATSKASLDWAVPRSLEGLPSGLGKLLLNMIALAEEMLPRGGALSVALRDGPEQAEGGGWEASVTASGDGAKLRAESELALAETVAIEDLTPRNVQGYFTRLLAGRMGAGLAVDTPGPDRLRFVVTLSRSKGPA